MMGLLPALVVKPEYKLAPGRGFKRAHKDVLASHANAGRQNPSFPELPNALEAGHLFIEGIMQFYPRALGSSSELRGGRETVTIPTPAESLCDTPSRLVC